MDHKTIIGLIETMSVVLIIATVVMRLRAYEAVYEQEMTWRRRVWIGVLFGLLSMYGTISGVHMLDAIASIRDLGPVLAGFIAGPFSGVLAGLIGAVHRYFQGGFTALSGSISAVVAGLIAGLYCLKAKGEFPRATAAVLVMAGVELLHSGLVLLLARPFEQAFRLVEQTTVPMVLTNALGVLLFAMMISTIKREKAAESAKHLIEGELKAARDIQMGILPKVFEPSQYREFELFAHIEPAKEVGGDFYDFFFVDKKRLCFVIGDVSGKGVPAALFMAVAKTLIHARALNGQAPDEILNGVNEELSKDNDSAMFVTVFCGMLDIDSGEIVFANGGHNPPYLVGDGTVRPIGTDPGRVVGVTGGYAYRTEGVLLRPGNAVFLYTDGVTEAMDKTQSFFTAGRLEEVLAQVGTLPVREAGAEIMSRVKAFCSGAEQFDDIAIMGIRYRGRS